MTTPTKTGDGGLGLRKAIWNDWKRARVADLMRTMHPKREATKIAANEMKLLKRGSDVVG